MKRAINDCIPPEMVEYLKQGHIFYGASGDMPVVCRVWQVRGSKFVAIAQPQQKRPSKIVRCAMQVGACWNN